MAVAAVAAADVATDSRQRNPSSAGKSEVEGDGSADYVSPKALEKALEKALPQLKKEVSRHANVQLSGLLWAEGLIADKAARRALA